MKWSDIVKTVITGAPASVFNEGLGQIAEDLSDEAKRTVRSLLFLDDDDEEEAD